MAEEESGADVAAPEGGDAVTEAKQQQPAEAEAPAAAAPAQDAPATPSQEVENGDVEEAAPAEGAASDAAAPVEAKTPQATAGGAAAKTPLSASTPMAKLPPSSAAKSTPGSATPRPGSARTPRPAPKPKQEEEYHATPRTPEESAAIAEAVARRVVTPASGKGGAPRPRPISAPPKVEKPKPSPPKAPHHLPPPKPTPKPSTTPKAPEAAKSFVERVPKWANKAAGGEKGGGYVEKKTGGELRPVSMSPKGAKFGFGGPRPRSAAPTSPSSGPPPAVVKRLTANIANPQLRAELESRQAPRPMFTGSPIIAPSKPLPPVPRHARVADPKGRGVSARARPSGPSKASLKAAELAEVEKMNEEAKAELAEKLDAARARAEGGEEEGGSHDGENGNGAEEHEENGDAHEDEEAEEAPAAPAAEPAAVEA